MQHDPNEMLDFLDQIAEQITDGFEGTHYADLGIRMTRYLDDLRRTLSYMFPKPNSKERFFDMQHQILLSMRETQALIRLSMDQSRPMSKKQLCMYLDCTSRFLSDQVRLNRLPEPYHVGGRTYWRKHEVDTCLFTRRDEHKKPEPVKRTNASGRAEKVTNVVRLIGKRTNS